MIEYIIANKEWIFSGIGVAVLTIFLPFIIRKKEAKTKNVNEIKDINLNNSNTNNVVINQPDISNNHKNTLLQMNKLNAYEELFSRCDRIIKEAEIALSPIKWNPPKTNFEYIKELENDYITFLNYFESKEILFDNQTAKIITTILRLIRNCMKHQILIESYKNMNMKTESYADEIEKQIETYQIITEQIPSLKIELKTHIQLQLNQ